MSERKRILEMKRKGELVGKLLGLPLRAFEPNYNYGDGAGLSGHVTIPACAVDLICELHEKSFHPGHEPQPTYDH